jgi:alpha-N-arabinofuranosidase
MALAATVRIEAHRGCRPYDRMIFGQFLEHFHRQVYGGVFEPGSPLADGRGFRTDVIEALRELRIPIVRWPGGCFVSAYHWKDGIGPDREPTFDKAWNVEEPNTFGTDEFVAWCEAIGAEPYICTNAGTGTAEEMSDWVEYCNGTLGRWARRRAANGHEQPHGVKYWSIGNENWGGHEIGAKKAPEWAALVTESGKMMLRADPSIKLLAAALPDVDWTLPLLRAAGRYLSYISIHAYWDSLWQDNNPSDYGGAGTTRTAATRCSPTSPPATPTTSTPPTPWPTRSFRRAS